MEASRRSFRVPFACRTVAVAVLLLITVMISAESQVPPPPTYAPTHWPIRDGVYHIHDFRFGSGETLGDLRLHYLGR